MRTNLHSFTASERGAVAREKDERAPAHGACKLVYAESINKCKNVKVVFNGTTGS